MFSAVPTGICCTTFDISHVLLQVDDLDFAIRSKNPTKANEAYSAATSSLKDVLAFVL